MVDKMANTQVPAECIRLFDAEAQLDGVIVLHSTVLGPAAGGCRLWTYPGIAEATDDALRLAEGMSFKNAMAGLPFGGGKAVIRRPAGEFDRAALFRAFGRAVEALGGLYVTAEDVGTSVDDMEEVATVSRHVAGRRRVDGRAGGDPSPWTAEGVFLSIQESARLVFGRDVGELSVAVQGTGNVGAELCRKLADAGARLLIADPNGARRDRLQHILGARVIAPDEIVTAEVDIFAPCALGGVLDGAAAAAMKARLVCGGANNQLASPDVARLLLQRGITYVPDYVANAGGIINVAAEYIGEDDRKVAGRVAEIGPRVASLLDRARREGRSPAAVADEMAIDAIAGRKEAV